MQINQWVEEALKGEKRLVIPIMTHPGIELCGKTVKEAVTDGAVHAEAIIKLNETYPADASTVIMDLTVEAEAFGAKIVFPEDEVPSVTERLVSNRAEVEALQIPSLDTARIPEYLKANRLSAVAIQDKPVLGGCIGPFSLAGRLFDLSEMMMALYMEPETMTLLLEKCTTFLTAYCRAIKETGVNGVIMAEPAAGLVSNDDCNKFSTDYVRRIVEELQDENFIIILHNCGNGGHATDAMVRSKAKGLHFGNKIDMVKALEDSPADVLVMGNLDPVGLFKQSTREEVYQTTKELLDKTKGYKNFIISSGCDVPPHIPVENITAFYQAVQEVNA
ncbi:uroporphyrinogen decarboxylase family protein [Parabacteroides sp. OttesenSCG-928-G06]|nr:uroporphyrinogen decarboxylase family protein [Parabacteroides sp. OttesenSCG-928-G06]